MIKTPETCIREVKMEKLAIKPLRVEVSADFPPENRLLREAAVQALDGT